MADRAAELRRVIREAGANGWTGCASFVVVRITEHRTSDTVRAVGWWDKPTYTRTETLDFSYRRACALLRQPLVQSDFHA